MHPTINNRRHMLMSKRTNLRKERVIIRIIEKSKHKRKTTTKQILSKEITTI